MFLKIDDRCQIVEATDQAHGADYIEIQGSVANNLPAGLLGFNGTVFTPNYTVLEGIVAARTEEDKAHDPYSDPPRDTIDVRQDQLEAALIELAGIIAGGN